MKSTGIMVGSRVSPITVTITEFLETPEARSMLGKLLLDLLEENTWSSEYEVHAILSWHNPRLIVRHPSFGTDSFWIFETTEYRFVSDVEEAICAHLHRLAEQTEAKITTLQKKRDAQVETARKILIDKAHAALVEKFPEAKEAKVALVQKFPQDTGTAHRRYTFALGGELYYVQQAGEAWNVW